MPDPLLEALTPPAPAAPCDCLFCRTPASGVVCCVSAHYYTAPSLYVNFINGFVAGPLHMVLASSAQPVVSS